MSIRKAIQPVLDLWSLIVGLGVTGKYCTKPTLTQHYPRQVVEPENLATFKGHVELVGKPKNPGKPKCIGCMLCATSCPSKCLTVLKAKAPKPTPQQEKEWADAEARGEKPKKPKAPKEPAKFIYDYSLCSLCGTCVEACPVSSLTFSNNVYLVGTSRKEFKMDLLQRLHDQTEAGIE